MSGAQILLSVLSLILLPVNCSIRVRFGSSSLTLGFFQDRPYLCFLVFGKQLNRLKTDFLVNYLLLVVMANLFLSLEYDRLAPS